MLFRLGEGEEEEASSFVPTSISGNRASRPIKWSLGYLEANAEEEGGKVIGGGSFGETRQDGSALCVCSFCASHLMVIFELEHKLLSLQFFI